ncbi:MAG TPA: NifU N-terminal domain-containing protein [Longimicrobiales bacterium]
MPEANIRFQPTPNPNAGKFIVDRKVVEGTSSKSFYNADDAADHPLAAALFEVEGVASLFMVDDFVTVTKHPDADWNTLIPKVQAVMEQILR